jgi:predicted metalloprotease with PDZ domain
VHGTAELDYTEALQTLGLRFRGAAANRPARAWLGITTRNDGGRLVVSQVKRGGPAHTAGLNVDDEIIAIDQFRVRADQFNARLDQYQPGETVALLIARRDQLLRLEVVFSADAAGDWRLEPDPGSDDARQQRARWLQPPA